MLIRSLTGRLHTHFARGRRQCKQQFRFKMASTTFTDKDGFLYCEDVRLIDLVDEVSRSGVNTPSPMFVYSKATLLDNIVAYKKALATLSVPGVVSYAMKANANISLLKLMQEEGCFTTLVSGMELQFGEITGFSPEHMLFNGNGKTRVDIERAVRVGCLLNVDSDFDCQRIHSICQQLSRKAKVLLRINPHVDPKVHPYVSTGLAGSKFGISVGDVDRIVTMLSESSYLQLVGLHCHVGSTVHDVDVYRSCLKVLLDLRSDLQRRGFSDIQYVNLGGGLDVDYHRYAHRTRPARLESDEDIEVIETHINSHDDALRPRLNNILQDYKAEKISRGDLHKQFAAISESSRVWNKSRQMQTPTPADLIDAIRPLLTNEKDLTLVLEPGRSLVGSAGIMMTSVLGCKQTGQKRFVITDGSMTEVIRPSLYGAYHHIELTEPVSDDVGCAVVDVVGPVCESADFLGKDRLLPMPHEGCGLAVFDVGAYCASMASNYNLRVRPCEVLVDGNSWQLIREPDSLEDLLKPYQGIHCGRISTISSNP